MKKPIDTGDNRTGAKANQQHSKRMQKADDEFAKDLPADITAENFKRYRLERSEDAPPLGTMPKPASLKGAAKNAAEALKGDKANVFLNLMGERLAFERTGVRLYEALIIKYRAGSEHGAPDEEDLRQIRDEELAHMAMLKEAIERMGGDPTAVTPAANASGVAGMGLVQLLGDPRTTFTEGLRAILIAELADNDSWVMLTDLADGFGQTELAENFRQALEDEERHLGQIRGWLAMRTQSQAGLEPHLPELMREPKEDMTRPTRH